MDALPLPYHATSNKAAVIIAMIMLMAPIFTAAFIYLALNFVPNDLSDQAKKLLPIGYLALLLPLNVVVCSFMKPRRLLITPGSIDVQAIPVFGYASTTPETRSVTEFKSVDYVKSSNGGRRGPMFRIFLRSVADKKDLVVDAPKGADKFVFAAQLGAALKLEVNNNA